MPTTHRLSSDHRSIIAILLVAAFVVILNETAMNVALNRIMEDFSVNERLVQWLTTAFMLTMAVVIPVTGWLLDRATTRQAFLLAMSVFSAGTLLCAVAPGFGILLAGRVVQAIGTAIMMPLLMTTIMKLVPPHGRGAVMGNVSLVISAAPAIGPTASGLLLQLGTWRLIFGAVVPIALAMLFLGWRKLIDVDEPRHAPLDLPSVALSAVGFGAFVYGLSLVGDETVPFWEPLLGIGIGLGGIIAFAARQLVLQRRDAALLDLRTFTYPVFTVALLMMSLGMMALFGTIITLPIILQRAFGLEPVQVGLLMLPGALAMGLLSPLVGRLYDRVGPRPLVIPASLVVGAAFIVLSTINPGMPWWVIMICHAAMSVALAFVFTPLFTVALGSVPQRLYSHGSALVGTVQQLAGAAGTALFVTIMTTQMVSAQDAGLAPAAAMLAGTHWSFLGAGAVWTAAIVAAFFVRRPPDEVD